MKLSPRKWQRFRSIVEQVDDCPLERRAALLEETTAGDDELRAAVEAGRGREPREADRPNERWVSIGE